MRETRDMIQIPFSPPDVGEYEIEKISEALRSGWITTGPRVSTLEQRLAGYIETGSIISDAEAKSGRYDHRVACLGSATAAIELNLRILGIGPGDEVVVPAYTYTATASPVLHVGADLVLVDIQKNGAGDTHGPEMDYDALERAITPRTKAVMPVDFGGLVCDYDRIFEIVERKKDLFTPKESDGTVLGELSSKIQRGLGCPAVVADSAHSLGSSRLVRRTGEGTLESSEWRFCGAIAHFTAFSFHAVKNLTTAEGGAGTWCLPDPVYAEGVTNEDIYKAYYLLSLHGQSRDALSKADAGGWEYDVLGPWFKCNMTDLSAAMGLAQLDRYEDLLARRRELISLYDSILNKTEGVEHVLHDTGNMRSNGHLYPVRVHGLKEQERNEVMDVLDRMGVATNVHYKPLPKLTAYRELGWDIADFPNAYDYYANLITLPLYSRLSDDDAEYVCRSLGKALREQR